ncbi:hypothetical protein [Nioella ostreopsis]|uniref:hypothetical protein n=1 Tax=Nioella ostreopsis TaxID=2448479 RepID=UPI000FD7E586|nr:hypothetical protein [Nioella ostreopsis]
MTPTDWNSEPENYDYVNPACLPARYWFDERNGVEYLLNAGGDVILARGIAAPKTMLPCAELRAETLAPTYTHRLIDTDSPARPTPPEEYMRLYEVVACFALGYEVTELLPAFGYELEAPIPYIDAPFEESTYLEG